MVKELKLSALGDHIVNRLEEIATRGTLKRQLTNGKSRIVESNSISSFLWVFQGTPQSSPKLPRQMLPMTVRGSDDGNRSIQHFEAITARSERLQTEFESICRTPNPIPLPRSVPDIHTLCLNDTEVRLYQYCQSAISISVLWPV